MAESESNVYDSDESDSDLFFIGCQSLSGFKKNERFPKQAADWTLDNLSQLGVKYKENSTDLETFMSNLKTLVSLNTLGKMPKICHILKQLTSEKWSFSYNLEKDKRGDVKDAMETKEKITEHVEEFEKDQEMDERVKQDDEPNMRLYFIWRFNLLNFWRYLLTLLARWNESRRRGRYTDIFTAFSKVFFLHPEISNSVCDAIGIKDSVVHGKPDIRYLTMANETLHLFTVTEINPGNAFTRECYEETFTFKHIGKNVLGRHGIQLIIEARDSFFFPYVVGLVCIGTKIIFTYLYIEREDYYSLREEGFIPKPNKASISYTRPFDFMDSGERQSIMDYFFWFGFVQSHAYKY
ncbi:uncharacterized protein LOC134266983 [Saccostrea cucullata]|uniref:uncharacterized protein LOC134266983 n=1 Tax=Saccostrea cuccullata TaxID=36930 RepID=UPI002ED483C2